MVNSIRRSRAGLLQGVIGFRRNLVAHIPKLFVEKMLHTLVQHFDRRAHCAHHASADDSLRQLQMMEAEQVNPFVEIEQPLGQVMQAEEFLVRR